VTAKFAYIRWHGHGTNPWYNYDYKPEELEAWVPKVKEVTDSAERVYGYFNNHFSANAVKNAVEMLALLDSSSPEQNAALRKIIDHRKKPPRSRGIRPLEDFAEEEEGLSVADLLMRFTTNARLKRAEVIENEELTINRDQGGLIEASIKDYQIKIDLNGRVLRHNCEDWRKGAEAKRMCKHAAKLFLSLPERKAKEILEKIWDEKENWRFEAA